MTLGCLSFHLCSIIWFVEWILEGIHADRQHVDQQNQRGHRTGFKPRTSRSGHVYLCIPTVSNYKCMDNIFFIIHIFYASYFPLLVFYQVFISRLMKIMIFKSTHSIIFYIEVGLFFFKQVHSGPWTHRHCTCSFKLQIPKDIFISTALHTGNREEAKYYCRSISFSKDSQRGRRALLQQLGFWQLQMQYTHVFLSYRHTYWAWGS